MRRGLPAAGRRFVGEGSQLAAGEPARRVESDQEPPLPSVSAGGDLGAVREALRALARLGCCSAQEGPLRALVVQSCRQHVAGGGTVDELAVSLGITLAAARALACGRWP